MILRFDVLGSVYVGNYGIAANPYLITLEELGHKIKRMEEVLGVNVTIPIRTVNFRLLRPFFAGNSKGILISKIIDDETIGRVKRKVREIGVEVHVMSSKYTAIGNLISANDKGAVISPLFTREEEKEVEDVLDVEVVRLAVDKRSYVGSLLKANNKGGLISPFATDEEVELVKGVMKAKIERGTVNSGMPFISSGILANDRGALVGSLTDGVELLNISNALQIS